MPELPISIAQHYHERTKYDPQTIAAKNKQLDWEQQPVPFKEYKIGATFDLKPYLRDKSEGLAAEPDVKWWQRLSRLLLCSYGLTAKVPTMGGGSAVFEIRAFCGWAVPSGGLYNFSRYGTFACGTLQLSSQDSFVSSFLE